MYTKKELIMHLKIKCKTLAAEASIIKQEGSKCRGEVKMRLDEHRKGPLRKAARHNMLAYALVRGIAYEVVEQKFGRAGPPVFGEVKRIACRFGADPLDAQDWIFHANWYLGTSDGRPKYVPVSPEAVRTELGIVKNVDTSQFEEGEDIYITASTPLGSVQRIVDPA